MPATVCDAYHLLRQALTQPDPVVFIEHKSLYAMSEEVNLTAQPPDWGEAVVRRRGEDLVIVTYSRQLHHVMRAAEELAKVGIEGKTPVKDADYAVACAMQSTQPAGAWQWPRRGRGAPAV